MAKRPRGMDCATGWDGMTSWPNLPQKNHQMAVAPPLTPFRPFFFYIKLTHHVSFLTIFWFTQYMLRVAAQGVDHA